MILDETTAYVDPEKEILIQEAINSLVKSKTLIIIAHRLRTIATLDQILVVDGGRVIEQGNKISLSKDISTIDTVSVAKSVNE